MPWLYLLRHGIAEDHGADPPLSTEGIAAMRDEALGMKRLGLDVGAVLSSPLQRAVDTARTVAEVLAIDDVVVEDRLLPGCRLSSIDRIDLGSDRCLLVGHAPDMGRLAAELSGARGAFPLRRGGMAGIAIDRWPPGPPGSLHFLLPPEILIAAARNAV